MIFVRVLNQKKDFRTKDIYENWTVSMPLHWEEVKKGLAMKDFTILNAIDRIKNEEDIFKPVLGKGIDLTKILKKINQ